MLKKIVISAAGRGTRMRNMTKDRPKHLIEVKGKPFIFYLLKNILAAGFKENDITIVVGYKKEVLEKYVLKYYPKVLIIDQYEMLGDQYGTACPIKCVEHLIKNDDFLSVCGDNLYSPADISQLKIIDSYNYVSAAKCEKLDNHGVLFLDNEENLERIVEKSNMCQGRQINAGMYKFTPEIFGAVKQIGLSPRDSYELTDAVNFLAKRKKVKVKQLKGYWLEITKLEDVIQINGFLENRPMILK